MEPSIASSATADAVKEATLRWHELKNEVKKVVVGQDATVERILIGLLCNGHILLEGVPGLAKTTLIKTIAKALGLKFSRIQFTPDLLPADLIGTLVYNPKTQEFVTRKGPVFANMVLADEINRAPSKVQSALLEAMQEHQVTIGDTSYPLEQPFLVLATQNPVDQEGTYRLPEAQLDRFLFKLLMGYPQFGEEKEIVSKTFADAQVQTILHAQDILDAQHLVRQVYVDERVIDYIVHLVFATRNPRDYKLDEIAKCIQFGASPRATIALTLAAKGHAFMRKRHFVTPDDVKAIAPDVLRHRILLTYEAEADNVTTDLLVHKVLRAVQAP